MVWSARRIPGPPALLVADASGNQEGWEGAFCQRLVDSFQRRGLALAHPVPLPLYCADKLRPFLKGINCLFVLGRVDTPSPERGVRACWEWLNAQEGLPPLLLALCTWGEYDPNLSQKALGQQDRFAPFALAQTSLLTPREAGLYFLKFFTELHLHSPVEIAGKMVWFSASKATALLRRRGLFGTVGVQC